MNGAVTVTNTNWCDGWSTQTGVYSSFCYQCYRWPCSCGTTAVYPYVTTGYVSVIDEPKSCIGKAHVFECDHVPACKCGAITRVMPKPKADKKGKR